jgi:hypothetical protein
MVKIKTGIVRCNRFYTLAFVNGSQPASKGVAQTAVQLSTQMGNIGFAAGQIQSKLHRSIFCVTKQHARLGARFQESTQRFGLLEFEGEGGAL